LHRERIPSDREVYIGMHIKRLETLAREGIVERDLNGVFHLPEDYEAKIMRREGRGGRESAGITLLDRHSLQTQESYRGPTLLDSIGESRIDLSQLRDSGFGRELLEGLEKRKIMLRELGLGHDRSNGFYVNGDAGERLRRMEQDGLKQMVEQETGRVPHFASDGERVHGLFVSRVHGANQTFALIVNGETATLAPWRPEMDRALNQFVSGTVRGRGFDFKSEKAVEKSIAKGLGIDF
jgi:hypothetical protein